VRADHHDFCAQTRIAALYQAHNILRREGNSLDVQLERCALVEIQKLGLQRGVDLPLQIAKRRNQSAPSRFRHDNHRDCRILRVRRTSHRRIFPRVVRAESGCSIRKVVIRQLRVLYDNESDGTHFGNIAGLGECGSEVSRIDSIEDVIEILRMGIPVDHDCDLAPQIHTGKFIELQMGCGNTIADKRQGRLHISFRGQIMRGIVGTQFQDRTIHSQFRRSCQSCREHPEVLEVGARVARGLHAAFSEGIRYVFGSKP
jgi:hypothetical protein